MWKLIPFLVVIGLCNTLRAQPLIPPDEAIITSKTPAEGETWGERIAEGAAKRVADLEARIATLEQLTTEYAPTWTWPGHNGPEPFEALRRHMNGEVIHPKRDVSKWTRRELAFVHDREHVEEYLAKGKALPLLKDQRLRDWLRAKSPAKALPKKLGWSVKRIVMHTMNRCTYCDQWKAKDMLEAQAEGVTVEVVADNQGLGIAGNSYPYFEVEFCSDDQCRKLRLGNMRYQSMKQTATSL